MRRNTDKDRGTVLLTTLLIMAVMAAVSVAIMDDIRFAVKRVINVNDYAQADWYMKGAEDFAGSYISQRIAPMPKTVKNQLFQTPQVLAFPFEGGGMSLTVRDGSHCFSLGSLVTSEGTQEDTARLQFKSLLTALGWPENEASNLTDVLTDWIDKDTQRALRGAEDGDYLRREPGHRTANAPLNSVMELRALEGMTEELYQSIRPYLCARRAGEMTRFNINTATPLDAFVLAALLGGAEHVETATRLITERPPEGYDGVEAITTSPAWEGAEIKNAAIGQIIDGPEKLWVEVQVQYLNATRLGTFEFDALDNGPANLTYRGWGAESFRPILKEPDKT